MTGDEGGDKIVIPSKLVKYLEKVEKMSQIPIGFELYFPSSFPSGRLLLEIKDTLDRLETLLKKLERVSPDDEYSKVRGKKEMEDISEELNDSLDKVSRIVNKQEIVGRDEDIRLLKEFIIKPELVGSVEAWLRIIVIRGEPGIGKTSVAHCLCNDEEVLRSVKATVWQGLWKNLNESKDERKGFLIVMDNSKTWPHHEILKWLKRLTNIIFIVTTSIPEEDISAGLRELERRCGGKHTIGSFVYELKSLKDDHSWDLFKSKTFINWSVEEKTQILTSDTDICRRVFKNCANNLRVIKTVAAILSTRHTLGEWEEFCDVIWESLKNPIEIIQSKLSIDHLRELSFTLRRRLFYCLLFPRDYEFPRNDLIGLWPATSIDSKSWMSNQINGNPIFGDPLVEQGYFVEGNVSYRMVSFMYELVKSIERDYGWRLVESSRPTQHIGGKDLRHVSVIVDTTSWHAPTWILEAKELRSLVLLARLDNEEVACISNVQDILSSLRHLETLHLADINCEGLLSHIGELKNLRYLRLGPFSESRLPEGISNLQNLRYLGFQRYSGHRVPEGFQKLSNLRYLCTKHLQLTSTNQICIRVELTSLPAIDLDVFIGRRDGGSEHPLVDYNRLNEKIEKTLDEKYSEEQEKAALNDIGLGIDSHRLLSLSPSYKIDENIVLGAWHPSQIVKNMAITSWKGTCFPRFFPALLNCTSIQITECNNCKHLPDLSILPHLNSLEIWRLDELEFVQIGGENKYYNTNGIKYFPSLKFLMMADMPRLKGWSSIGNDDYTTLLLSELRVSGCAELMSMPRVSSVECLEAINIPEKLMKQLITSTLSTTSKLRQLQIKSVHGLDSLIINHPNLKSLTIRRCKELQYIKSLPNSLEVLNILECGESVRLESGKLSVLKEFNIEHCECELNPRDMMIGYNGLESLRLANISNLTFIPNSVKCITTLKKLTLTWVYNITTLPEWIHNMTNLTIHQCHNLTRLPESIDRPSNIQHLVIRHCPKLKHLPANLPNLIQLRVCEFKRLKETIRASENLRELEIENDLYNFDDENSEVLKRLQSLKLNRINNMESLPDQIGQFTKLEQLSIQYCPQLTKLPEFIRDLRSLRKLEITGCVHLQRVCQPPSPEIWSIIQHIPEVHVDGVELKR